MKVNSVIDRIHDIDMAISNITDDSRVLTYEDREHISMFLENYKSCLLSREVEGSFSECR